MNSIRIGTRSSPLALAQTYEVIGAFKKHHPHFNLPLEIVPMTTTGDAIADRSLTDMGGKSLFTKEIEQALLRGRIDIAVHSMKDVTTEVPQGLTFPAMLEREDPRDALVTHKKLPLPDLPKGSVFGTSSLRRQAYILHTYPHLPVVNLRGNVPTRLKKIETGEIGAALFAVAGLKRLGILHEAIQILSLEECLPAVAQGAIGIQCREEDTALQKMLVSLNHLPTFQAVTTERAFLKALQGSCRTPIAGYAHIDKNTLIFRGMISDPDGNNMHFISCQGSPLNGNQLGEEAALQLRHKQCATSL